MAAAGVVVHGAGRSIHTPGAGAYSSQSPIEQHGTPFSVTSRVSNGERPQSAEPLTGKRVVPAASLGSAPVAGDKSCCPSLKACFEKVWTAVKWFFNLLVEFFIDLCCPKSPLQLLESNKALVEALQVELADVNLEAIQSAFKAMPEKAQLRIAVAAYDNYQVGAFQPPVLSAQDKLNHLLSGSWAIYPMLRRFLNGEEGPAPHTSQHPSGGAASSISLSGQPAPALALHGSPDAEAMLPTDLLSDEQIEKVRQLLRANGRIMNLLGPKSYEVTKEMLLDALHEMNNFPLLMQALYNHNYGDSPFSGSVNQVVDLMFGPYTDQAMVMILNDFLAGRVTILAALPLLR